MKDQFGCLFAFNFQSNADQYFLQNTIKVVAISYCFKKFANILTFIFVLINFSLLVFSFFVLPPPFFFVIFYSFSFCVYLTADQQESTDYTLKSTA